MGKDFWGPKWLSAGGKEIVRTIEWDWIERYKGSI